MAISYHLGCLRTTEAFFSTCTGAGGGGCKGKGCRILYLSQSLGMWFLRYLQYMVKEPHKFKELSSFSSLKGSGFSICQVAGVLLTVYLILKSDYSKPAICRSLPVTCDTAVVLLVPLQWPNNLTLGWTEDTRFSNEIYLKD